MQDHLGYTQDRPAVNSKNTEMRYKQDHLGYMQDGNLTNPNPNPNHNSRMYTVFHKKRPPT